MNDTRTTTVDGAAGFEAGRAHVGCERSWRRHYNMDVDRIRCGACDRVQTDTGNAKCCYCGAYFEEE